MILQDCWGLVQGWQLNPEKLFVTKSEEGQGWQADDDNAMPTAGQWQQDRKLYEYNSHC
jgi:hypothetical protein